MRRWAVVAAILAALALAYLVPSLGLSDYYVSLLSQTCIYGIAAMSLDLLVGFSGLVSFSHAAFFGTGAYMVAILATRFHLGAFGLAAGVGIAAAVVAAALFGLLALRGEGVSFIIISLALNEIIWGLAYQWVAVSGGDNGITGFSRPTIGPLAFSGNAAFYYLTLSALVLSAALMLAVARSPFGLVLRGLRERPRRMRALGYNVWLFRYLAFLLTAAFAGLAGVLFAYYNQFVGPTGLSLDTTVQMLIMVILGGTGTLFGPLVGAGIVVFVSNALSNLTQRWELILGAIYVAILMYAPDGLVGAARRLWHTGRRWLARRPAPAAPPIAAPPPVKPSGGGGLTE